MRRRLSTISTLLLVMAVVLGGLAACSRPADERESESTGTPATVGQVSPDTTAAPGETVVSALTPVLAVGTTAVGGEAAAQSTAVALTAVEPPATTQPAPTPVPPATKPPAPDAGGDTVVHVVKRGETLFSIAEEYGTTTKAIVQANDLSDASKIYSGQKLTIPTSGDSSGGSTGGEKPRCSTRHKVKKGEWLWQIARDYGVSPYDIMEANGLTRKTARNLSPGQVLCIP